MFSESLLNFDAIPEKIKKTETTEPKPETTKTNNGEKKNGLTASLTKLFMKGEDKNTSPEDVENRIQDLMKSKL